MALMLDRILNGLTRPFWGWVSDHIGRYNTMAMAFALEGCAIIALLRLVDRPVWFVIFTGYGIQYTTKGTASIFAGWGAAAILEATGSWIPVFWIAVACDPTAALLAVVALKPLVSRRMARAKLQPAAIPLSVAAGDD